MHEQFLYYVWQFQFLDKTGLTTTEGEEVFVFDPGIRNLHSGPDFRNARIRIGRLEWRGSVEIHVNASDWMRHRHAGDPAYENVVLHVVWNSDKPIVRNDSTIMPTIELVTRVDDDLIKKYRKMVHSTDTIPCSSMRHKVNAVTLQGQLERSLVQRLETKTAVVSEMLSQNRADWEETCYQLICRNYGFKVNSSPFLDLARALPYKVVLKHSDRRSDVEALIFGIAGLLTNPGKDAYPRLLAREYQHLRNKYDLQRRELHPVNWRFLRLRPANFPTVRMAQLAALLQERKSIFSSLLAAPGRAELLGFFGVEVSEYWTSHYRFSKKSKAVPHALGEEGINNLIINTVVPLLFAYGRQHADEHYVDRAMQLLENTPPESNHIVRKWAGIGLNARSAFDTQAMLEQYSQLCLKRQCLNCSVGVQLIRPMASA